MFFMSHCGKRNVIGVAIVRSKSSPESSPVVQSTDYRQPYNYVVLVVYMKINRLLI